MSALSPIRQAPYLMPMPVESLAERNSREADANSFRRHLYSMVVLIGYLAAYLYVVGQNKVEQPLQNLQQATEQQQTGVSVSTSSQPSLD